MAPSVNSAVTLVSPFKSSTPFKLIQLVPLNPSNLVSSELYLICPATPVGRCSVLPAGNLSEPVASIITSPLPGFSVILLVELIVLLSILNVSITILPVPDVRNSKSLFEFVVVIKLSSTSISPVLKSVGS